MSKKKSIEENSRLLRVLLAKKGWKSGELAEEMGRSKQWISNLLNPHAYAGRIQATLDHLKKLKDKD